MILLTRTSSFAFAAWTMVKEAYALKKGDWVLVHAAAGGVGLLLCQMASHLGAHVIGTTSTPEKAKLAKENGAEHIINYSKESIVDKVLELTGGNGVQGIYDGVGKDTWEDDFKVIARKGTIVTFGNASGAVEPFTPLKLAAKNVKGAFRKRCERSQNTHDVPLCLILQSAVLPWATMWLLKKSLRHTAPNCLTSLLRES
jgi:NADPH:quinone reductase-like Zn-dependent oxidoreductase